VLLCAPQVLEVYWRRSQLWGTIEVLPTPSGLLLRELYAKVGPLVVLCCAVRCGAVLCCAVLRCVAMSSFVVKFGHGLL
jgi:hypothetical protein